MSFIKNEFARIIRRNGFLLFILVLSLNSVSYGQKISYASFGIDSIKSNIPHGLTVGDKAPDFTGYDQKGKHNYQDSLKVINDQGFNVVAITPESIENVEQTVKLHNITFTVIYDCQEKIMKDYDVMFNVTKAYQDKILSDFSIDIAKNNGRDAARLPVPATYIINKEGIIVAVQFDPDFHNRATVKWMLKNMALAY
ncbi:MAG: redoxin domain-containing protein [Bacteroidales bacterium]